MKFDVVISSCCFLCAVIVAICGRLTSATSIYFTTDGGGVKAYSLETSTVTTIVASTENLDGIAYDPMNQKIYYSSPTNIYRANTDGSSNELVWKAGGSGDAHHLYGLAFDWFSGRLYITYGYGYIFVCNTAGASLDCTNILLNEFLVYGITLDPLQGYMYMAGSLGNINIAEMDGSNKDRLVTSGQGTCDSITVDAASFLLYWVNYRSNSIHSSFLNGTDPTTIIQLPGGAFPWGLVKIDDNIYWSTSGSRMLQKGKATGEDRITLYTGNEPIHHLAVV